MSISNCLLRDVTLVANMSTDDVSSEVVPVVDLEPLVVLERVDLELTDLLLELLLPVLNLVFLLFAVVFVATVFSSSCIFRVPAAFDQKVGTESSSSI